MKIPEAVHEGLRNTLWAVADRRGWMTLTDQDKSLLYEQWSRKADIGGVLSRYLEPQAVRVYIKDTLMKPYMRERLGDHEVILRLCGVDANCRIAEHHIKPNGLRLMDGRVVAWGRARDWKAVLFAVFERSYARPAWRPFTAVLLHPSGKTRDPGYRALIDDAARRFEIEQLVWFED